MLGNGSHKPFRHYFVITAITKIEAMFKIQMAHLSVGIPILTESGFPLYSCCWGERQCEETRLKHMGDKQEPEALDIKAVGEMFCRLSLKNYEL